MDNVSRKAAACFRAVFPDLKAEDLPGANTKTVAAWDSVAQVTLLSSLSEEFGVDFDVEDFEKLDSYSLIVSHLRSMAADA